jgi:undecaprenyl-diphosphatase
MQVWEAVVLGVVQGVTEFLPISSTAHLLVARELMGHGEASKDAFTTVIQLGTVIAVFWYFRADVIRLLRALVDDVKARKIGSTPDARQGWLIVLGTLPVVVVGFFFKKWVKATFYDLLSIAVVSILFALLLAMAELWSARRKRLGQPVKQETDVGWKEALWIGCFQALALMPGGSRSGTTITAGLFAGLARPAAARFSFLLSLPAVLGAGLKELFDDWTELTREGELVPLSVGLVVSAVVGYLAIAWLLGFLKTNSTYGFVVYRLLLGLGILGLLQAGVISR